MGNTFTQDYTLRLKVDPNSIKQVDDYIGKHYKNGQVELKIKADPKEFEKAIKELSNGDVGIEKMLKGMFAKKYKTERLQEGSKIFNEVSKMLESNKGKNKADLYDSVVKELKSELAKVFRGISDKNGNMKKGVLDNGIGEDIQKQIVNVLQKALILESKNFDFTFDHKKLNMDGVFKALMDSLNNLSFGIKEKDYDAFVAKFGSISDMFKDTKLDMKSFGGFKELEDIAKYLGNFSKIIDKINSEGVFDFSDQIAEMEKQGEESLKQIEAIKDQNNEKLKKITELKEEGRKLDEQTAELEKENNKKRSEANKVNAVTSNVKSQVKEAEDAITSIVSFLKDSIKNEEKTIASRRSYINRNQKTSNSVTYEKVEDAKKALAINQQRLEQKNTMLENVQKGLATRADIDLIKDMIARREDYVNKKPEDTEAAKGLEEVRRILPLVETLNNNVVEQKEVTKEQKDDDKKDSIITTDIVTTNLTATNLTATNLTATNISTDTGHANVLNVDELNVNGSTQSSNKESIKEQNVVGQKETITSRSQSKDSGEFVSYKDREKIEQMNDTIKELLKQINNESNPKTLADLADEYERLRSERKKYLESIGVKDVASWELERQEIMPNKADIYRKIKHNEPLTFLEGIHATSRGKSIAELQEEILGPVKNSSRIENANALLNSLKQSDSYLNNAEETIGRIITHSADFMTDISRLMGAFGFNKSGEVGYSIFDYGYGHGDNISGDYYNMLSPIDYHSHPYIKGIDSLLPSSTDIKSYMYELRTQFKDYGQTFLKEAYISNGDKLLKMSFDNLSPDLFDSFEKELLETLANVASKYGEEYVVKDSKGNVKDVLYPEGELGNYVIKESREAMKQVFEKYGLNIGTATRDINGNIIDDVSGEKWISTVFGEFKTDASLIHEASLLQWQAAQLINKAFTGNVYATGGEGASKSTVYKKDPTDAYTPSKLNEKNTENKRRHEDLLLEYLDKQGNKNKDEYTDEQINVLKEIKTQYGDTIKRIEEMYATNNRTPMVEEAEALKRLKMMYGWIDTITDKRKKKFNYGDFVDEKGNPIYNENSKDNFINNILAMSDAIKNFGESQQLKNYRDEDFNKDVEKILRNTPLSNEYKPLINEFVSAIDEALNELKNIMGPERVEHDKQWGNVINYAEYMRSVASGFLSGKDYSYDPLAQEVIDVIKNGADQERLVTKTLHDLIRAYGTDVPHYTYNRVNEDEMGLIENGDWKFDGSLVFEKPLSKDMIINLGTAFGMNLDNYKRWHNVTNKETGKVEQRYDWYNAGWTRFQEQFAKRLSDITGKVYTPESIHDNPIAKGLNEEDAQKLYHTILLEAREGLEATFDHFINEDKTISSENIKALKNLGLDKEIREMKIKKAGTKNQTILTDNQIELLREGYIRSQLGLGIFTKNQTSSVKVLDGIKEGQRLTPAQAGDIQTILMDILGRIYDKLYKERKISHKREWQQDRAKREYEDVEETVRVPDETLGGYKDITHVKSVLSKYDGKTVNEYLDGILKDPNHNIFNQEDIDVLKEFGVNIKGLTAGNYIAKFEEILEKGFVKTEEDKEKGTFSGKFTTEGLYQLLKHFNIKLDNVTENTVLNQDDIKNLRAKTVASPISDNTYESLLYQPVNEEIIAQMKRRLSTEAKMLTEDSKSLNTIQETFKAEQDKKHLAEESIPIIIEENEKRKKELSVLEERLQRAKESEEKQFENYNKIFNKRLSRLDNSYERKISDSIFENMPEIWTSSFKNKNIQDKFKDISDLAAFNTMSDEDRNRVKNRLGIDYDRISDEASKAFNNVVKEINDEIKNIAVGDIVKSKIEELKEAALKAQPALDELISKQRELTLANDQKYREEQLMNGVDNPPARKLTTEELALAESIRIVRSEINNLKDEIPTFVSERRKQLAEELSRAESDKENLEGYKDFIKLNPADYGLTSDRVEELSGRRNKLSKDLSQAQSTLEYILKREEELGELTSEEIVLVNQLNEKRNNILNELETLQPKNKKSKKDKKRINDLNTELKNIDDEIKASPIFEKMDLHDSINKAVNVFSSIKEELDSVNKELGPFIGKKDIENSIKILEDKITRIKDEIKSIDDVKDKQYEELREDAKKAYDRKDAKNTADNIQNEINVLKKSIEDSEKILDEYVKNYYEARSLDEIKNITPSVKSKKDTNIVNTKENANIVNTNTTTIDSEGGTVIHSPHVTITDTELTEVIKTGTVTVNADKAVGKGLVFPDDESTPKKKEEPKNQREPISKYRLDDAIKKMDELILKFGGNMQDEKKDRPTYDAMVAFRNELVEFDKKRSYTDDDEKTFKNYLNRVHNYQNDSSIAKSRNAEYNRMVGMQKDILSMRMSGEEKSAIKNLSDKLSDSLTKYVDSDKEGKTTREDTESNILTDAAKQIANEFKSNLVGGKNSLEKIINDNISNGKLYDSDFNKTKGSINRRTTNSLKALEQIANGEITDPNKIIKKLKNIATLITEYNEFIDTAKTAGKTNSIIDTKSIESDIRTMNIYSRKKATSYDDDLNNKLINNIAKLNEFKNKPENERSQEEYELIKQESSELKTQIELLETARKDYEDILKLKQEIIELQITGGDNDQDLILDRQIELEERIKNFRQENLEKGTDMNILEKMFGTNEEYERLSNSFVKKIESLKKSVNETMERKISKNFGYTADFTNNVKNANVLSEKLIPRLLNIKNAGEEAIPILKEAFDLISKYDDYKIQADADKNKFVKLTQLTDLLGNAGTLMSNTNVKGVDKDDRQRILAIYGELKALEQQAKETGGQLTELDKVRYDNYKAELSSLEQKYKQMGLYGINMFDRIKRSLKAQVTAQIARYFSLYDIIRYARTGIDTIKQLDTAMVELRKVTDGTAKEYDDFQKTIRATAVDIASTNQSLISSAADWARLGYSIKDATGLAKDAQIFANVGDGVDIKGATDMMITAMKAFNIQAEDALSIVDKYNEIGNNFALSATDIGDAMQRSASVLAASNTSFNESIALITASNEILQDPEKTGTALRTIALRIRGAKSELEEMGEETDYVVKSSSKLRDLIKGYTSIGGKYEGFDIMEDENTFKSLADIIKGIGKVYGEMSDIDRTAMLEKLAGKNRSNALAAMLTNYEQIDNVLKSIEESEGSALEENAHIVDSVQGRLTILQTSAENFWQAFLDTNTIKNGITLLTDLLNALTKLTETTGALPAVFASVVGIWGHNVGIIKNYTNSLRELEAANVALKAAQKAGAADDIARLSKNINILEEQVKLNNPFTRITTELNKIPKAAIHVTAVLTIIIGTITLLTKKQVEHIKKVREMADEYGRSAKKLKEYEEKIRQLHEVIDDENSTVPEVVEAKEKLNDINNELTETYDELKGRIDLANESLETSINLINQIDQRRLNQLMAEATSISWSFSKAIADGFQFEDLREFGNLNFTNDIEDAEKFLTNGLDDLDFATAALFGDTKNAYEQYAKLLNEISKNESIILSENSSDEEKKQASIRNTELNKTKARYDKAFANLEEIGAGRGSTLLAKYTDNYGELIKAQTNYATNKTEENKEILRSAIRTMWEGAADQDKAMIEAYFKMMYPDLALMDNWRLEEWLNTKQSDTENTNKEYLVSLAKRAAENNEANNAIYDEVYRQVAAMSEDEFHQWVMNAPKELAYGVDTNYALDDWRKFAQSNTQYSVDDMIAVMQEAGYAPTISQDQKQQTLDKIREEALKKYGKDFAYIFDSLNIKTEEEAELWRKISAETNNATDAVKAYNLATSDLGKSLDAGDILKNMQEQYKPAFDALAESYKEVFADNKFQGIDKATTEKLYGVSSQIDSINEKLKEAGMDIIPDEAVNDFLDVLTNKDIIDPKFKTKAEEVQEAYNNIATVIVDSLDPALSQASGDTALLMKKQLEDLGVTNAEQVIYTRLGYTTETYAKAKEEAARIGFDLDDDISQLNDEKKLLEIINSDTLMEYYNGRIMVQSQHLETADDIQALLNLCDALGVTQLGMYKTAEMAKKLGEAMKLKDKINTYTGTAKVEAEKAYNAMIDELASQAKVAYEAELEKVNVDGNKNKSSSSSDSSKDSKQKFDWIERAIKKIQRAVTNLGKVADATYKTWGERLDAIMGKTEEFHDEIGQFGRGNIDLYNRPQYINEDGSISTVRSMSFGDEYGNEILVPTIAFDNNGNPYSMSDDEAIARYYETGEYLGLFKSIEEAEEYAEKLHEQQEAIYAGGGDKFYAGKYQKLKEEIALQEQAAQAYMAEANAIGLSAEYRSKVMNGLMDIETVTNEKLKEQISDFQELYINMQPYLIMVWKIILIAGNPQRQLHYNMTMKYAWV